MDWEFYRKQPTDPVRNPIGGEFFSTEAVKNATDAIIREAIQNSIDARSGEDKPVRFRVFISGTKGALPPRKARRWFENLWPHIMAPGNGLREQPNLDEPCPFLVIEDFNTTGLTGDPTAHEISPDSKNDFLNFFRAEGHSDKSGEKGGSWGIGKNVFPRSSRINSYFGYTVRHDGVPLLLGRSIIKFHTVGDVSYKSDGYWGISNEEGLVCPVSDHTVLSEFREDFNVMRDTDPGTSIVVPWYNYDNNSEDGISFEGIAEAVVRGFFYSILRGVLEVELNTHDPSVSIVLNQDNFINAVKENAYYIEGLTDQLPLIELASWMNDLTENDLLTISPPKRFSAQKWDESQVSPEQLEEIHQRLTDGERLAIKVPMAIRRLHAEPEDTFFNIYMQKAEKSHRPVFIRDELVIPDVKPKYVPSVRSLVVIKDEPIAELLRLAETPAHTQWSSSTGNFKNQYQYGASAISYVTNSVSQLISFVNKAGQESDPSLTIDFFSVPVLPDKETSKSRSKRSKPEPGEGPASETPILPNSTRRYQLSPRPGGFSIIPGDAEWDKSFKLIIKVAYDVRRGNAFKRYSKMDFDLKNFEKDMEFHKAHLLKVGKNELQVEVTDANFKISVDGFDKMRDLITDVKVRK